MSEFKPIRNLKELSNLNEDEILAGYYAGLRGDPEPGNLHSKSYWHGWRNGAVDSGRKKKDEHQSALASETVRQKRKH